MQGTDGVINLFIRTSIFLKEKILVFQYVVEIIILPHKMSFHWNNSFPAIIDGDATRFTTK